MIIRDKNSMQPSKGLRRIQRIKARYLARCFFIAIAFSLTTFPHATSAQSDIQESAVKAAFLFNFAKFTSWPASSFPATNASLTFCIEAQSIDPKALLPLAGKTIENRTLKFSFFEAKIPAGCHVIYGNGEMNGVSLKDIILYGREHSALTISDSLNFASNGGNIGLIRADNQLRFEINLVSTERSGLNISSKVLHLAKIVESAGQL